MTTYGEKKEYPDLFKALAEAIPGLVGNDKNFGLNLHDYYVKYKGWSDKQSFWAQKMVDKVTKGTPVPKQWTVTPMVKPMPPIVIQSALLAGIPAMLLKAKANLKNPSIMVPIPAPIPAPIPEGVTPLTGVSIPKMVKVKLTKGGQSCTVVGPGPYPSKYYGKLTADGVWTPGFSVAALGPLIGCALEQFAENPAKVAGVYGHLHGSCCFCNKKLTDPQSTTVGYGPICAGQYGLPWGDAHNVPKLPPKKHSPVHTPAVNALLASLKASTAILDPDNLKVSLHTTPMPKAVPVDQQAAPQNEEWFRQTDKVEVLF